MAESFLFSTVENVLKKIGSVTLQEIGLAWGVESELKKLEDTLSTIKAVLFDAEEQQAKNRQLSVWLERLKDVCYDAEDVLDEVQYEALRQQLVTHESFKTKVHNIFPHSNIKFRFKMGYKLKKIRERLDEIAANKTNFHLTERTENWSLVQRERETYSFVQASNVIGRDEDKEFIVQLLMHIILPCENVSVISIVGIGGLGKTTLAKLLYNDERVVGHFNMKIWVCVSEDFDVKMLAEKIIDSATGTKCGGPMEHIQTFLQDTLMDKIFLIVLDDVWNNDLVKWLELMDLLKVGAKGSKIIVTTRSPLVASVVGSIYVCNLKVLPHKDCLSLFVKWAFREGDEKKYPNLLRIGEEIVNKCGGVPLAVRTLGSLLYSKTDERDWLYVNDNEIWELEQKENDILPVLRLSYSQMPSYLKQCFAFCSIFPKDFEFNNVDLIQLWIAQGLIQSSNQNQELEDIGERYIKELRLQSFFQDVEEYGPFIHFKMHNLVHDLALLVAQTECYTINYDTHNISKRDTISKMVRHVSFSGEYLFFDEVPKFLLKINNLRTILFPIWRVGPTSKSFVETCISRFKYLRVLDLRTSLLEVLPISIGNLKHLRYLDLSWNDTIKKLPNSICKLQNLQTLRLEGCSELEELPRDMENLINLRFLLLTTNHMFLPGKGIGCLSSLRFLGIGRCGNLKSLGEGMQCFTTLRTLSIVACNSLESLSRNMKYLAALETLVISYCEKLNSMEWEEDIQGLRLSLRSLWIEGLPALVALPQWLQGAANTLQLLHIQGCRNLKELPEWLQNLMSLQKLEIVGCPELSALPEGMHRLATLRELKIQWCSPELSSRCIRETGEDWPKIAHVPKIIIEFPKIKSTDSESHSQPDDTPIPAKYERLQQKIARRKEENRVLRDMVVSGRSTRDEAGQVGQPMFLNLLLFCSLLSFLWTLYLAS